MKELWSGAQWGRGNWLRALGLMTGAMVLAWAVEGTIAADVRQMITLTGDPLVEIELQAGPGVSKADIERSKARRRLELDDQHREFRESLESLGGKVEASYTLLNNAMFVSVPEDRMADLAKLRGIQSIEAERHYSPQTQGSLRFVGVPPVWGGLPEWTTGVTGRGVRIGVIDTGIDYMHAHFGGSGLTTDFDENNSNVVEAGTFPTQKVVGGWDFVGDNYDSEGVFGSRTARPDPDPLDTRSNAHGTHVAGIAAGQGVLKSGASYSGPYGPDLNPDDFEVFPGVAPEALLYAYKVFGGQGRTSSSIVVSAMNRAADPNQDGVTNDRLDIVNLSLGTVFGHDDLGHPELAALDRLVRLGSVVVVSAGNGGNTAYKIALPGTGTRSLTVANSYDDAYELAAIRVEAPAALAGEYPSIEGTFTPRLSDVGPVVAQVVAAMPALACGPLQNTAAVNGRIALVDRGTCFFVVKVREAQNAGAIGVIVINNVPGPPTPMGAGEDASDIVIPAVMITQEDGARLRSALGQGLRVRLSDDVRLVRDDLADTLNESSSRGPVWSGNRLKPDLVAPGSAILSAQAGSGTDGIRESGTSMAAPHVSGAAALLKQRHPTWTAEDIKAALMNTAVHPLRDADGEIYPETRVGAGRLSVVDALRTSVTARAVSTFGEVSLSFGDVQLSSSWQQTRTIQVKNHGSETQTLNINAVTTLDQPGVVMVPLVESVTIGPGATAFVNVQLHVDPAQLRANPDATTPLSIDGWPRWQLPEAGGNVWFTNATQRIHVPWLILPRPVGSYSATSTLAGLPDGNIVSMPLPTRGASPLTRSLVGVFELGATPAASGVLGTGAASDIVAVGVTSDYGTVRSVLNSTLYFGVVLAGPWQTTQRAFLEHDVEIDLNLNGAADVILSNGNRGSALVNDLFALDEASDAWIVALRRTVGTTISMVGPWHPLGSSDSAVAGFQNAHFVYAVSASDIGLTPGVSRFRYRVVTFGTSSDSSAWISYDPVRWVLDATPEGQEQTPFHVEGQTPVLNFNRTNALALGHSANGTFPLLLIHGNNAPGNQFEVIRWHMGTGDVDNDGLPDAWELAKLGDMQSNGGGDRDGDGFSDFEEFLAGTDPWDPDSYLRLLTPTDPGVRVRWTSVAGRRYTVLRSDHVEGPYVPIRSAILATPDVNSFRDLEGETGIQSGGTLYYRVQVDIP